MQSIIVEKEVSYQWRASIRLFAESLVPAFPQYFNIFFVG